jgi:hypothetical protein
MGRINPLSRAVPLMDQGHLAFFTYVMAACRAGAEQIKVTAEAGNDD